MGNNHGISTQPTDFNQQFLFILQTANIADSTRQKYIRVVEDYLDSGKELTDQNSLAAYAATLSRSRRGHLKSAIRKCVEGMATAVKGQATPENINSIQATLLRFEALQDAIQVSTVKGQKSHTWLSQREVRRLLSQPACASQLVVETKSPWACASRLGCAGKKQFQCSLLTLNVYQ